MSVFTSLLNNDFRRWRRRRTSDGQGGFVFDYPDDMAVTVRGRIRPASSSEREVARKEERLVTHVFYCLAAEDVRRGDRLVATSPSTGSGGGSGITLTVEVDGLREPSLAGEHLEFDCNERQAEISAEEESGS